MISSIHPRALVFVVTVISSTSLIACSAFSAPDRSPSMSQQATPDDTASSFAAAASAREKSSMLALMTPKARAAQDAAEESWVKLFSDPRAKVLSTSADPAEIDGDQAKVHCRVRYVRPGEANEHEDRLRFRLKRNNGRWWISELE